MALHTVTAHTESHGACAHSSRGVAADHLGLSHLGHTAVIALLTSSIPPGSPHTLQDPCPPRCFAGALQSLQRADTSHVPLQPTNWLLTPWSRSVPIALGGGGFGSVPPQMCVTCRSSLPAHLPGRPAHTPGHGTQQEAWWH